MPALRRGRGAAHHKGAGRQGNYVLPYLWDELYRAGGGTTVNMYASLAAIFNIEDMREVCVVVVKPTTWVWGVPPYQENHSAAGMTFPNPERVDLKRYVVDLGGKPCSVCAGITADRKTIFVAQGVG